MYEFAGAIPAEVADLLSQYAHVVDSGRYEEWPELFTEPCLYRIRTRDNHDRGLPASIIFCDSRAMLEDRVVSIRTANVFEPHRYRHHLSCLQLVAESPEHWELRSNFLVTRTMPNGTMSMFSSGEYLDEIIRENGSCRFRKRLVICDHSVITNLIALPL